MINEIEKALEECTQGDWQWKDPSTRKYYDETVDLPILENSDGEEILNFGCAEQYYPTEGEVPRDSDALVIANATKWLRYLLQQNKDLQRKCHVLMAKLPKNATTPIGGQVGILDVSRNTTWSGQTEVDALPEERE